MGKFFSGLLNLITLPIRTVIEAPGKLLAGSGRLAAISLAAKISWATFLFLVIVVTIALVSINQKYPENMVWRAMTLNIIGASILVILIPLVLYKVLQLWMEGETTPFVDIKKAWDAGLAELHKCRIDIRETPLYLVLGSSGSDQIRSLFDSSKLNLVIRDFPQPAMPLNWYANSDGIYLVLSDVGSLSCYSTLASKAPIAGANRPVPMPDAPIPAIRRGHFTGQSPTKTVEAPSDEGFFNEDLSGRQFADTPNLLQEQNEAKGTIQISEQRVQYLIDAKNSMQASRKPVVLDSEDANTQAERVQYLARLLNRARQPLCPINGILALLHAGLIQRGDTESKEIQRAVDRDMNALLLSLRVRCPITALVTGMEDESGFRELMSRVGRPVYAVQRIGKSFELWNEPTAEAMKAVAWHAYSLVEKSVYSLFSEPGGLSKPGNAKLYMLLCKLRNQIVPRLEFILEGGFGFDPARSRREDRLFFGGCYFAALGQPDERRSRQGFAKGVLDKLPLQQGYLAWTSEACATDDRYRVMGQFALVVDTLLVLGLAALVTYHLWPKS